MQPLLHRLAKRAARAAAQERSAEMVAAEADAVMAELSDWDSDDDRPLLPKSQAKAAAPAAAAAAAVAAQQDKPGKLKFKVKVGGVSCFSFAQICNLGNVFG